jgi:hypothetical protein
MTTGEGPSQPAGGLSAAEIKSGLFVTVSENNRIADRSLVDAIWEVVALNEAHAVLRFYAGLRPLDPEFETRVVLLHEHTFYPADHLVAALDADHKQPSAAIIRIHDR